MKRIRVSAINGAAKKAALGAMLAGSVAMFATNPNRITRTDNPPQQTEVLSKDGSDALKAITFPQQTQNPAVPKTHNKALDERFLKIANNDEEKNFFEEFLSNLYKSNGSYLANATIQMNIDLNMFMAFLDGNIDILKKFDGEAYNKIDKESMKKVTEKSEPLKQWLNENYFAVYNEPFGKFDHPPDYEELNDALDDYIENDPYKLFEGGLGAYRYDTKNCVDYLRKSNMDIVQKKSNLLAAKTHVANEILFKNLLKSTGIYNDYKDVQTLENFNIYMRAVTPVKYW